MIFLAWLRCLRIADGATQAVQAVPVEPLLSPLPGLSGTQVAAPLLDHQAAEPADHVAVGLAELLSGAVLAAVCTTRSRTAGIDNGRFCAEPGLSISTRRAGSGRYVPALRSAASSSSSRVTPYRWRSAMVVRSMPAAPRLRRTLSVTSTDGGNASTRRWPT